MKNNRFVYMNGDFVPESDAKVSIYDSALMFGDMVFEMTRSFKQEQFKLREHLERLYTGIKILRIPLEMGIDQMEEAVYQTIEKNLSSFEDDDEHRIMIDISRGLLGIYQKIDNMHKGPNVIIADFPLRWTVAGMGKLFDSGINAVISSQRAIPSSLMDPKIKNRSRLFYLMANIEVSAYAGDNNWALLLDTDGNIAEGTGDNFFIVKDGIVFTPKGKHILRGISRDYVINTLCKELNYVAKEKDIEPYDVYTADEAFMTGTPFCMLPVTSLNSLPIGDGNIGPIFLELINKWSSNTSVDIIQQIKDWNQNDSVENSGTTPYAFKKKNG